MIENGLGGIFVNSMDMDDFSGEFCSKGPYPFLSNSLGLLLHLDNVEKNITTSLDIIATTERATKRVKKPKNNLSNKLRINKYKILLKTNDLPAIKPKKEPNTNLNNYLEPIEFQERILKEQLKNYEKLETIKKLLESQTAQKEQQKLLQSLQEQVEPIQNFETDPDESVLTTESVPLQFYFTNKISENEKEIIKVSSEQQAELNKKIIEHLKAKQTETLNEWAKLQEKHRKQEQLFKSLLEQLEKPMINKPKMSVNQIDKMLIDPIVTSSTTTKKISGTTNKWEPKAINHQSKFPVTSTSKKTTTTTTTLKFTINKCYNKRSGIYRDEFNCSSFYICEEYAPGTSRMHKFNCPSGLVFDMQTCICVSL